MYRKKWLLNFGYTHIILIGIKLEVVKIENIKLSIDGTKIRANASGKLSKDEQVLEKLLSEVKEKVVYIMNWILNQICDIFFMKLSPCFN